MRGILVQVRQKAGLLTVLALAAQSHCASVGAAAPPTPPSPTVRHPAGFRFTQPTGWRVEKQEDGNLRLMPGDARELELVLVTVDSAKGITRVDDPRLLDLAETDLRQLFPFLERVGDGVAVRTALGPGLRLAWEGTNPADVEVRAALWAVLMGQKAVALFAVGPKEQIAAREAALQRLFAGFAPDQPASAARAGAAGSAKARAAGKPARVARAAGSGKVDTSALAKAWRQRLTGKKLTTLSSYSSGSSGGYSSRYDLYLNRDGTFLHRGGSSVSIYVEGATGSSAGQEESAGKWRIFARAGQPMLELTPSTGKPVQFVLASQGSKTFLNGNRVFVTEP
jgi:hypothetical protein